MSVGKNSRFDRSIFFLHLDFLLFNGINYECEINVALLFAIHPAVRLNTRNIRGVFNDRSLISRSLQG